MIKPNRAIGPTIGRLDRVISELILLAKMDLDEADWQTMKHHAEDMEAAARAMHKKYADAHA